MNIIEKPYAPGDILFPGSRQRAEEERGFSQYPPGTLEAGYEFKILRDTFATLAKPEALARILREEQENGWQLVEKLDNNRLRLMRQRPADPFRSHNGIDPYRVAVGDEVRKIILMLFLSFIAFGIVMYQLFFNVP